MKLITILLNLVHIQLIKTKIIPINKEVVLGGTF